ncbi:hypothetical protein Droror1_Dr00017515 [Drosera rotundifolia]
MGLYGVVHRIRLSAKILLLSNALSELIVMITLFFINKSFTQLRCYSCSNTHADTIKREGVMILSVRSHYKCQREDGKANDQGDATEGHCTYRPTKDYGSDVPRRNRPSACR